MIHLMRPCVGVESIEQLHAIQQHERRITHGPGQGCAYLTTRNMPRRVDELMDGGSVYWVMKQRFQVRQRIEDIQQHEDEGGRKFCLILLNPELVRLQVRQQRGFQGWRYLDPAKAPADLGVFQPGQSDEAPPQEMAQELRALGLL